MRIFLLIISFIAVTNCTAQNFIEQHNLPLPLNSICKPFYKNTCGQMFYALTGGVFDSLAVYNENTHVLNTYYLPCDIVIQNPTPTHIINNSLFLATSCTNLYMSGSTGIIQYNSGVISYFPFPNGTSYTVNQLTYKFNKLYVATNQGILILDNQGLYIAAQFPPSYNYAGVEAFSQSNKMLMIMNSVLYTYDGTTFTILNTGTFNLQNVKCIRSDNNDGIYLVDKTNQKFYHINSQFIISELNLINDLCEFFAPRFWLTNSTYIFSILNNDILIFDDNLKKLITVNKFGSYKYYYTKPINVGSINPASNYFFNNRDSIFYTGTTQISSAYNAIYYSLRPVNYKEILLDNDVMICKRLDINDISSLVSNRGDANFYGAGGSPQYFAPKTDNKSTVYTTGLFINGIDDNGNLHKSANTYRGYWNGQTLRIGDYWPGPLDTINATVDSIKAKDYNRVWKINKTDVENFIAAFQNGSVQSGAYKPSPDFISWPCNDSGNYAKRLAPFFDNNNNAIYNYLEGDYPIIKGDQAVYAIFNDVLAPHTVSLGSRLGVEVHLMAYEYYCIPNAGAFLETALNNTVFYDYEIINRSNNNYHSVSFGFFEDVDLGNYRDDYGGCRPKYNYGFTYNSDNVDDVAYSGYGLNPPIQNTVILNGPLAKLNDGIDNDNDGTIDEAGEKCLMTSYYSEKPNYLLLANSADSIGIISHLISNGFCRDSSHIIYGGTGYGPSGTTTNIPVNFMFDGVNENPNSQFYGQQWTEESAGIIGGDRMRVIGCSGFDLASKQRAKFELADVFVWSRDAPYAPYTDTASDYWKNNHNNVLRVIDIYNNPAQLNCASTAGEKEIIKSLNTLSLYPNPTQNMLYINNIKTFEQAYCRVYSITGSLVIEQPLKTNSISVAGLGPGLYMIQISTKNGINNLKFVKE